MRKALDSIQLSITRQLAEKASPSTIRLALGEPNLPLSDEQKGLYVKLMEQPITLYSPTDGLAVLKQELVRQTEREFGPGDYHTLVTTGTQQALFMALGALSNPGDGILLITPHYPSYEALSTLYQLKPSFVKRQIDGRLPVDDILASLNENIRFILLNSPNNPTASVDSEEDLQRLYAGLKERDITVLSDEVYFGFSDDDFHSAFHHEKTVLIRGISKTFGLTGFRLAWVVARDADLISRMKRYQQNINTCPNTHVQLFVTELLKDDRGRMQDLKALWNRGRELTRSFCEKQNLDYYPMSGSFYALLSLKGTRFENRAWDFALHLLEKQDVLVVPSKAFGEDDGYFRINVLVEPELLNQAFERIAMEL